MINPIDLLSGLNPEQQAAVIYNQGPQLVIAGAGAGKTRVITHKIAYLIQQGITPNHILALTFTNKAAKEMTERTLHLLNGYPLHSLWIGTFHAIAAKILRFEIDHTRYRHNFSIYDTNDTKNIVKQICKDYNFNPKIYTPAATLTRISIAKNHLILPSHYNDNPATVQRDNHEQLYDMAKFYSLYQTNLLENNAMDFDDLLLNLYLLLFDNPTVQEKYCTLFEHILVDEYQDTNYIQNILIQLLSQPTENLCVVGDDAQSIYSFRGADIYNILNFMTVYKNARLFKLQQNYRSTQTIVNASNELIAHNQQQIPKKIFSQKQEGDKLQLLSFASDKEEGEGVARLIFRKLNQENVPPEHFAILYRTNAQSRIFENALRQWNIPYRIFGTTGFFQRKEIKDVLAYLRLLVNEQDNEALLRIINVPKRGIGTSTVLILQQTAINANTYLFDVITHLRQFEVNLSASAINKVASFASLLLEIKTQINTLDAYNFAKLVVDKFDICSEYLTEDTAENKERIENIQELLHAIYDFTNDETTENTDIAHFLQNVSLLTDTDDEDSIKNGSAYVSLMTIHNAKGLEFEQVIITGMEENLFPSTFCISQVDIEEERRLFYVAITRAMTNCYMTYANRRFKNGTINPSYPSRFLQDINEKYVDFVQIEPQHTPLSHLTSIGASFEPIQERKPIQCDLTPQCRVYHATFGQGTVIQTYNENDNDKVDIKFDQFGTKTLLLRYAKLRKIAD